MLTGRHARQAAWLLWLLLFVINTALVLGGSGRTVSLVYRQASLDWFHGHALYGETGWGFLYLPQAAIAFAPFAWLPETLAEILWRGLAIGGFAVGVWRLAELARREGEPSLFPLMTAIALPLAWDSARSGQMTLPMAALMILATADAAEGRWWRSAFWLSTGVALKPVILVLTLLLAAVVAPMRWRVTAATAAVLCVPFLFQWPGYVVDQYHHFVTAMARVSQVEDSYYFANIFGMLRVAGVEVPLAVRWVVRVAAALATLALAFRAHRSLAPRWALIHIYALACCYLMLWNPRAEFNGYSILGPVLAVFCAHATLVTGSQRVAGGLALIALGILGNYEIGKWFVSTTDQAVWLAPLMCSLFFVFLTRELFRAGPTLDKVVGTGVRSTGSSTSASV